MWITLAVLMFGVIHLASYHKRHENKLPDFLRPDPVVVVIPEEPFVDQEEEELDEIRLAEIAEAEEIARLIAEDEADQKAREEQEALELLRLAEQEEAERIREAERRHAEALET